MSNLMQWNSKFEQWKASFKEWKVINSGRGEVESNAVPKVEAVSVGSGARVAAGDGSVVSGAGTSTYRSGASTAAGDGSDRSGAPTSISLSGGARLPTGYMPSDPHHSRINSSINGGSRLQNKHTMLVGAETKQRKPRRSRKVSARNQQANVLSRKKRNTKSRN